MPLGKCDRCKTVVEPRISTQWFWPSTSKPQDGRPSLAAWRRMRQRCRISSPGKLQADLPQLDGEHPRLVHLAPALVGPSHSGLALRTTAPGIIVARDDAKAVPQVRQRADRRRTPTCSTPGSARGLLPFSTLGWPEKTRRPATPSIPPPADHRLRHPVLLGRPHDHDGLPLLMDRCMKQRTSATSCPSARCTSTPWCATPSARRCRRPRATWWTRSKSSRSSAPTPCASPWLPWPRPAPTSPSARAARRATAPSPTRSGTPRASSS